MTDLAAETRGLVKQFGSLRALDDFNLRVPTGQITGFLGPNGAGKSTAIRVILGLLRATSGTCQVFGQDAWRDSVAIHRRVAYVPGDTSLWPNLTGGEAIDLLLRIRGTTHSKKRLARLVERFELDTKKKARTYSKGNRQKVALVAALAADAELFVFDEPTSGLDPLMEAIFTDEARALRADGRTILLSSHILAEVEKLCDSVTIIRAGKDVETGTLAELRHLTRSTVRVTTARPAEDFQRIEGVHDFEVRDGTLHFDIDGAHLAKVLNVLAEGGVENVTITPPSLEDLFLRHYGDDIREVAAAE
ncbi:ABC transporter ATP-binding protein [Gulosibacter molinativorax]|uniref:ABC transporter ATP-binding protein n=1 Tax=Gulosibacter molinativorax TaxID=256821 RepID=A0ABT7CA47_9MICO|nr:ABC transporter ATP-binding protein [Gulosibacter molinativorax]MDJ1372063.1 ABC transporter ATP-binding protein [Gulosibacter molinativorax]QUY63888.1 ABC transporter, ATP-binding protein [Gulosibacter molinativorax]